MSTFARLWTLLHILPRQPRKASVEALDGRLRREGFSVTRRTVERDLANLREQFPIECDGARPAGWYWLRDAQTIVAPSLPPSTALAFTLAEPHLRATLPPIQFEQLATHFEAARRALAAIADDNPAAHWPALVRTLPRRQTMLAPAIDPEVYRTVCEALMHGRRLRLHHRTRPTHQPWPTVLDPLGLIVRDEITQLVAASSEGRCISRYSLHLCSRPQLLDEPCVRPPDFDLDAYIEQGGAATRLGAGEITLVALFDREAALHLLETPINAGQRLHPAPGQHDRWLLTVRVPDTLHLRWWLQGFGADVEILEPANVRAHFVCTAQRLAERYGAGPESSGA